MACQAKARSFFSDAFVSNATGNRALDPQVQRDNAEIQVNIDEKRTSLAQLLDMMMSWNQDLRPLPHVLLQHPRLLGP